MTPVVEISQSLVLTEPVSPLSPKVNVLLAVKAPLAVKPEVAVIRPEIVGVAVQAVLPNTVVWPDLPRVRVVAVPVPIPKVPAELVSIVPPPATKMLPLTSNFCPGRVVPIPTLPDPLIIKRKVPVP